MTFEKKERKYYSVSVMKRFLSERAFNEFAADYEKNLMSGARGVRPVNDNDLKVLEMYQKGTSLNKIAKELGLSMNKVSTALRIAALSKLK